MKKINYTRLIFYSVWLILLIIQAANSELIFDEAYYWMFSKSLAWGYFDQPPVIAVLIKTGYFFFKNELGVRLLILLCSLATLFIIEKIVRPKGLPFFYMLMASVCIFHFISIYAVPDGPFLLMASCFFLVYREFIKTPNWKYTILISIIVALMLLSKYHGILIVGFTLLSNPKLLKSKYTWTAIILTILMLLPHILWQLDHGLPSMKYHLIERSTGYSVNNTVEYIISQPFIFGPFTGIILLFALFTYKIQNKFERALKFSAVGGYLFFLLMTFKGRVEGNWTLFILIPSIYFGYHKLQESRKLMFFFKRTFPISIILILAVRIFMILDFIPINEYTEKYHGHRIWASKIAKQAKGCPVAFMNSYKKASLYAFYSGSPAYSLNNITGRRNQFDIWDVGEKFRGHRIMVIPDYDVPEFNYILNDPENEKYCFIDNFQSFSKVRLPVLSLKKIAHDTLSVRTRLDFHEKYAIDFDNNTNYPSHIDCQFFEGKTLVSQNELAKISNNMLNKEILLKIPTPNKKGMFHLFLTIKTGWLPNTFNSDGYEIYLN